MLLKKTNFFIFKHLRFGKKKLDGKNNQGVKTLYKRGGGAKRSFRVIDFKRYIWGVPAFPILYEYDPNRTAPITLISYSNGFFSFILAPEHLRLAYPIVSKTYDERSLLYATSGCASFLNTLKPGSYINSLEIRPLRGAQYVRSGGCFAKFVSLTTDKNYAIIKLKSKNLIKIKASNVATLGTLLKWKSFLFLNKNAGYSRRKGFRPSVRGVAKNPIDHPHGGGQGKTSGGRPSVTPWAYITKGRKTKKTKKNYARFVVKT